MRYAELERLRQAVAGAISAEFGGVASVGRLDPPSLIGLRVEPHRDCAPQLDIVLEDPVIVFGPPFSGLQIELGHPHEQAAILEFMREIAQIGFVTIRAGFLGRRKAATARFDGLPSILPAVRGRPERTWCPWLAPDDLPRSFTEP